jgi:hypothetical protein
MARGRVAARRPFSRARAGALRKVRGGRAAKERETDERMTNGKN